MLRIAAAVASKKLPIRPGDLVLFMVSGKNMLVACCSDQVGEGWGPGQRVAGILSGRRGSQWKELEIVWSGYDELWSIQRP